MKNTLIAITVLLLCACHKSHTAGPQDYTHLTSQQIWDSIGFKPEVRYGVYLLNATTTSDTIICHADKSITEIVHGDTIVFSAPYFGTDTAIHYAVDPTGKYSRYLSFTYLPQIDTIYKNMQHSYIFTFISHLQAEPLIFNTSGGVPGVPIRTWGCASFGII